VSKAYYHEMPWSNWESLGGHVGDGIQAVSTGPGCLDVIVPSRSGGHGPLHKSFRNNGWSGFTEIDSSIGMAPTAVARPNGRIDVFNTRYNTGPESEEWNPGLYHNWYDGDWHGWQNIDASAPWYPVVVSSAPDRIDVFDGWPGPGPVRHKTLDADGWHPWQSIGGSGIAVKAVSSAPGRIDVFAGAAYGAALYHNSYDNGWGNWENLGITTLGSLDAVSASAGTLDVFISMPDNAVHHRHFDGAWGPWESLGGVIKGGPVALSSAPGQLDVFVAGIDDALYYNSFVTSWSGWQLLGGVVQNIAAVSWGVGRIDVFTSKWTAADNYLRHISFQA
jgi:hypothetical protein